MNQTNRCMHQKPIIHVVDDDEPFQEAITTLLRAAGYEVRTYATAGHFLLATEVDRPGCILLDIQMPGPSGLELQKSLTVQANHLPVIFLTGHGDIPSSVRAIKSGAVDFLTKPVQKEVLLAAVQNALSLDIERRVVREQLNHWRARYAELTERERQVFDGVVAGKLNKQIADELGTAERTVKAHRAQVMDKMKVQSVADLVRVAEQLRGRPRA
jgi:FixJ family two-component response regulator